MTPKLGVCTFLHKFDGIEIHTTNLWCLLTMFQNYNRRLRSTFQQIIHTYVTLLKMTDRFREWSVFKTLISIMYYNFFNNIFFCIISSEICSKKTHEIFLSLFSHIQLACCGAWSFSYQKNDHMALSSEIDQSDVLSCILILLMHRILLSKITSSMVSDAFW